MGKFRIWGKKSIILDRPSHIDKQFMFLRATSSEGQSIGAKVGENNNGLLSVKFIPCKVKTRERRFRDGLPKLNAKATGFGGMTRDFKMQSNLATGALASTDSFREEELFFDEGVTGLQGKSYQSFTTASHLPELHDQAVTIHLRLVCSNVDYNKLTPLTAANSH